MMPQSARTAVGLGEADDTTGIRGVGGRGSARPPWPDGGPVDQQRAARFGSWSPPV